MVKGALIKFRSYQETVPKILELIGLANEIKKYNKIVLKPGLFAEFNSPNPQTSNLSTNQENKKSTNPYFVEQVLKFVLENKNPVAEVFIAEGLDGGETLEAFDKLGYKSLAEKYDIGLIDLNNAEVQEVTHQDFLKFSTIMYPKILLDSFLISLPKLSDSQDLEMFASIPNMLGAFPLKHYKGFLSLEKKKIKKWPIEYSIHDISKCKMPDLAIIDASQNGAILVGRSLEVDKQAAKLLGKESSAIPYISLIEKSQNRLEGEEFV